MGANSLPSSVMAGSWQLGFPKLSTSVHHYQPLGNYLLTIIGQQSLNTAQLMWVKQNPPTIFIGGINLPFPVYDIVLPSGNLLYNY